MNKIINPLIIPALLLAATIWLSSNIALLPSIYLSLLQYLPHGLLLVIGFLCVQFNQLRTLLIAMIISVAYGIIQFYLQTSIQEQPTHIIFLLLSTFIPIAIVITSWFPERGVINIYGLFFLAITSVPVIIGVYLFLNSGLLTPLIGYFQIGEWSFSVLAPLGILLYFLAIIHQVTRIWFYQQPFDAAVTVVLVALLVNFTLFNQAYISVLIFSAIQLILIWGVLKQSHDMAYRDELTGLPGRRALNDALKSPGRKYVIAMMDIDHFKKFNDKYGHDVGDDVLKIVASKMALVTGGGRAYRYGGEEFTVLFKGKELEPCIPHLEAVREDIARYLISIREAKSRPKDIKEGKMKRGKARKPKGISVTISIGVAKRTTKVASPEQVLKAADTALYKAKKAGRNCLVSA